MTWKLKDRELQKTLDEFSNGELNKRLSESITRPRIRGAFSFG